MMLLQFLPLGSVHAIRINFLEILVKLLAHVQNLF